MPDLCRTLSYFRLNLKLYIFPKWYITVNKASGVANHPWKSRTPLWFKWLVHCPWLGCKFYDFIKNPSKPLILHQNTANLCDFNKNKKKWLKIAEFISQNLKQNQGRTPLMCMVCYPRIRSVISPCKKLAALSISGINWSIHKKFWEHILRF